MIQVVWEYVVREEARAEFELAYGPGGAWSHLFARARGYRGTMLMRELENDGRYLTIDSWERPEDLQAMLDQHRSEYAALDAQFDAWTERQTRLGVFRTLAEAGVRPARRSGRRSPRRQPGDAGQP